jgi:hypothetical protein
MHAPPVRVLDTATCRLVPKSTSRHVRPESDNPSVTEHEPGCPLRNVAWMDGATEAALTERAASASMHTTVNRFDEVDVVADARLTGALRRIRPSDDELRLAWCTCRRGDSSMP